MPKYLLFSILLIATLTASPAKAVSYLEEIERAKATHFESDEFVVEAIDLGQAALGRNAFALTVTNNSGRDVTLTLFLEANPGLDMVMQFKSVIVHLTPAETRRIESEYRFSAMSPFAKLFVKIFRDNNPEDVVFRTRYHLGAANPARKYDLSKFVSRSSEHLNLYAFPGTLAAENADSILAEREDGLKRIAEMSGVDFEGKIDFYLFGDKDTKAKYVLHIGEGWGFNRVMVEVYNDDIKLDPFHEMSHIVTGTLGTPPPLFDEGFAVYVAEAEGADALLWLGWPGQKVDDVTRQLKGEGRLIPLTDLIAVTNIGDSEERAIVEYPESASFVKFLIKTYGTDAFRQIFSRLKNSDDQVIVVTNLVALEAITGKTLDELEAEWLEGL